MSYFKNKQFRRESTDSSVKSPLTISKPLIVGYMSVDVARQYYSDLSQLKFLNSISNGVTSLDLNHNISAAVKRTTDDNGEKIDLLLRFIANQRQYLYPQYVDVDIISYRRTLISIMCATYSFLRPIYLTACLYKGSIYLHLIETEQEKTRRESRTTDEKKYCAWGYKFEQYLLSDSFCITDTTDSRSFFSIKLAFLLTKWNLRNVEKLTDQPNLDPDIEKPVIENEEFSMYYHSTLGQIKLLYGAQIDGLLTKISTSNKPQTTDFETNVNYLRQNDYVELKTNREIQTYNQEKTFKRFKMLKCWCQCYLADLKGLYVGFRNDHGIIQRLQWYSTRDIVLYCQNEWDPNSMINFLHDFLAFIKHSFKPYQNQTSPVALQFGCTKYDDTISVKKCDNDILPSWFVENC